MRVVEVGGRIKAAAVGLDILNPNESGILAQEQLIRELRNSPHSTLLQAYFPRLKGAVQQMLNGVGLFRPILKTDQGMAGNFIPFRIDMARCNTDLSQRSIAYEEGIAVPETWYSHSVSNSLEIQRAFQNLDLPTVSSMLHALPTREADKGRLPFFFIRPAMLNQPMVFGSDMVQVVSSAVTRAIGDIVDTARNLAVRGGYTWRSPNMLYCQADVYVLANGTVAVERVHFPDVGLFLTQLETEHSELLPKFQDIMGIVQAKVYDTVVHGVCCKKVYIVTRDQVLEENEDILEAMEIQAIVSGLAARGLETVVVPISEVKSLPNGSVLLLMNVDYTNSQSQGLLDRHSAGQLECFPNPWIQYVSQSATGLPSTIIAPEDSGRFMQSISFAPKHNETRGLEEVYTRLDQILDTHAITSDIVHVDFGHELVAVLRKSQYSWRQMYRRMSRYPGTSVDSLRVRQIPGNRENLIITSDTGTRLHAFRFMYVAN